MKKLFNDVYVITKKDTLDPSLHLCKLAEETGELAQAINKFTGRKKIESFETTFSITENVKEEIADSIQVLFSLATCFGFSYEELVEELENKSMKYKEELSKIV